MQWNETQRQLRLDGHVPTVRDKWKALWRLFRMASRGNGHYFLSAVDAMRWLVDDVACVLHASRRADETDNSLCQKRLRRQIVERQRKHRLEMSQ